MKINEYCEKFGNIHGLSELPNDMKEAIRVVPTVIEEKIYQDMANYKAKLILQEAESIRGSQKIILED